MTVHQMGDKALSEQMMTSSLMHTAVTRSGHVIVKNSQSSCMMNLRYFFSQLNIHYVGSMIYHKLS